MSNVSSVEHHAPLAPHENTRILKGSINSANQNSFIRSERANSSQQIELQFIIKEKNMDELNDYLMDISNIKSPNYGKHLSKQQIDDMTANLHGREVVNQFLNSINAEIISASSNGNKIIARNSIDNWERALHCEFYHYHKHQGQQQQQTAHNLIRTPEYFLPAEVADEVMSVYGTVEFPVEIHRFQGR